MSEMALWLTIFRKAVRSVRKVSAVTKTYTESQQTYHGVVLQQLLITMAALCLYGVQLVPYMSHGLRPPAGPTSWSFIVYLAAGSHNLSAYFQPMIRPESLNEPAADEFLTIWIYLANQIDAAMVEVCCGTSSCSQWPMFAPACLPHDSHIS